jgi:hypothetical protein
MKKRAQTTNRKYERTAKMDGWGGMKRKKGQREE